jgi:branched-subunit amino acid aminotransferase/4-amino-4-deoxychorismate lyase
VRAAEELIDEHPACFSTARWTGERIRFLDAHAARIRRDASVLGLGDAAGATTCVALAELGSAAFGRSAGIVRLDVARGPDGVLHWLGRPRPLGPDPDRLAAVTLPFPHEPGMAPAGAKLSRRPLYARGEAFARQADADEGIFFDAERRLVEGTRTNLVARTAEGRALAPPAARGAVSGVALTIASRALPELERRDLHHDELGELRELVALNAVRGALAIVRLDGRPVGDGRPGPLARALRDALDAED